MLPTTTTVDRDPTPAPVILLGKCQKCRARVRVATVRVEKRTFRFGWQVRKFELDLEFADGHRATLTRQPSSKFSHNVRCACGGWAAVMPVNATKTDHACDERCRNAKGHDCECSCGGENHGVDA